jgi:ornithine carbamoyltransferase
MAFNLRHRSILKELDFSPAEWRFLVGLASELKWAKYAGKESHCLDGRNVVLLFERASTRTRAACEVAAHDQGAHVTYVDPVSSRLGFHEPAEDVARVLGRCFDGIVYAGGEQGWVDVLARYSGVPVWNGSTSAWCPVQSLGDVLTMREHSPKHGTEISFAYCGDARGNVGNSLLVAGAMMGMDVRVVGPKPCWNRDEAVQEARRIADGTGARIAHTEDIAAGVRGVDFLYTSAWLDGYEPDTEWNDRVAMLRDYQITMDVIRATGNADAKFMHSLPAFRDRRTRLARKIFELTGMDELEVTSEVFESPNAIVFDQAENQMHAMKAVMVATLGDC